MTNTIYNRLDASPGFTLASADLEVITTSTVSNTGIRAADGHTTGKYYYEVDVIANAQSFYQGWGVARSSQPLDQVFAGTGGVVMTGNGAIVVNTLIIVTGYGVTVGHKICLAIDLDNQRFWGRIDGGLWNNDAGADPATNTGGADISGAGSIASNEAKPVVSVVDNALDGIANFGDTSFAHAVPSGFIAGWPGATRAQPALGVSMAAALDVAILIQAHMAVGLTQTSESTGAPTRGIRLSWLRRNRIGGSPVFVTDNVPMSEATEAYDVEVMQAGQVVRTFAAVPANNVLYTAAMQIADGWTSQPNQLTLRVYQLSAIVGRGLVKEVTINVEGV